MSAFRGGEYTSLISHKRHRLVKIIPPKSTIQCLKIFTFKPSERTKIQLYKDQFQNVKEWLKHRYFGKSILMTTQIVETAESQVPKSQEDPSKQRVLLKVTTNYISNYTVDYYYQKLENMNYHITPKPLTEASYMHYFAEFFQAILRGASIKNFFYTPKNLFISRPPKSFSKDSDSPQSFVADDNQSVKITVNFLSTVGLQLLYLQGSIIDEDLCEIFALLPTNLEDLYKERLKSLKNYQNQVNRIIKMKALGWNILSFIVRHVPDILMYQNLNTLMSQAQVFHLLKQQNQMYRQLLQSSKNDIDQAQKCTGIDFHELFMLIFEKNCANLTWQTIYFMLFINNQSTKQRMKKFHKNLKSKNIQPQAIENINQRVLKSIWDLQDPKRKEVYLNLSIPAASNVYFLVRTNIRFRSFIYRINLIYYTDQEQFSSDFLRVHESFMESAIKQLSNGDNNDKSVNSNERYIIPYNINPPAPRNIQPIQQRAEDLLSVSRLSKRLSRTVNLQSQVEVVISHQMQNSISILLRNQWKDYHRF